MLSRLAFHQLKQQLYPVKSLNKTETGTDEPSIEEVEGFLSKYGAKLLITDTLHMLKEFYGIEIGDFIIVKKPSNIPARVVRIINNVFCFKVSDIRKDFSGIEVRLYLNDYNNIDDGYSGGIKSGIFYFFNKANIIGIVKNKEE
jgi:hypothetical protein